MGRNCTICIHPAKNTIDAALETQQPLRDIAAQFGISKTALHRHWQAHVLRQAAKATAPTVPGPAYNGKRTQASHPSRWSRIMRWGVGIILFGVVARSVIRRVWGLR